MSDCVLHEIIRSRFDLPPGQTALSKESIMKIPSICAIIGCLFFVSPGLFANTIFTANLTHDQESPPNGTAPLTTSTGAPRPLSFGTATFTLNDTITELALNATM